MISDQILNMSQSLKSLRRLEVKNIVGNSTEICNLRFFEKLEELELSKYGMPLFVGTDGPGVEWEEEVFMDFVDKDAALQKFNKTFFQLLPHLKIYTGINLETDYSFHKNHTFKHGVENLAPCALEEFTAIFNTKHDV